MHIFMYFSKNKPLLFMLVAGALLVGSFFLLSRNAALEDIETACTLEALICPDGSSVGRVGPSCEFAPCSLPEGSYVQGVATHRETGIQFTYPAVLPTFYSEASNWPPSLQIVSEPFSCAQAEAMNARTLHTELKTINGVQYCVTEISEGAAGSIYTEYTYAFPYEGDVAILTFSTRSVQCSNFEEVQQRGCENEQQTFSLDETVSKIAKSLKSP
jgi:hypothetical protein